MNAANNPPFDADKLSRLAKEHGTPLYVYSRQHIEQQWQAFDQAFGTQAHLVCYAVKANSNLAVLNVLARLGSGFDIVSGGELARVLAAGGKAENTVFSGVGKTQAEIQQALAAKIRCFNVESEAELAQIDAIAQQQGQQAPISLRVNPDVDPKTHPYISTGLKANKFGINIQRALAVYRDAVARPGLNIQGIDCHIGSQLLDPSPLIDAAQRVRQLIEQLQDQGIALKHVDLGGGLGIQYQDERAPSIDQTIADLIGVFDGLKLEILIEPGRAIVGNAGVLITKVLHTKAGDDKHFAIVDAAMNDLARPSLYQAWHHISEIEPSEVPAQDYDIVGPICETGDFLGKQRTLRIRPGDLLSIHSAGAYGFTMASNYNSRPRAAEIMLDGDQAQLIRERETIEQLYRGEHLLP